MNGTVKESHTPVFEISYMLHNIVLTIKYTFSKCPKYTHFINSTVMLWSDLPIFAQTEDMSFSREDRVTRDGNRSGRSRVYSVIKMK